MSADDRRAAAGIGSVGGSLDGTGTPASPAQLYDALLGGKDNYDNDEQAAAALTASFPQLRTTALAARDFLRRAAVHLAVQRGFEQFIDLGSGMPAPGHLGDVLAQVTPWARWVGVDNDPVVVRHGQARLVTPHPHTVAFAEADLRRPAEILAHDAVRSVLDLHRPTVLVLGAVLHFLDDRDDPAGIVRDLVAGLPAGGALIISHATGDFETAAATKAARAYNELCRAPITPRSHAQITALLGRVNLIGPGLVQSSAWGPEKASAASPTRPGEWIYGAVALIPRPSGDAGRASGTGLARESW
jgi:hypothetical protein